MRRSAPSKVLVVAPDSLAANLIAERVGIKDRDDFVWVRDPRQMIGVAGVHVVEAYSTRPFAKLQLDQNWKKQYELIQAQVMRMIKEGKIDTYALVNIYQI